jgi:lysophospholipase L1-like esterase
VLVRYFGKPRKPVFLALGDSMVSDDYPGKDQGAASLLYRNCDRQFPEFAGCDLARRGVEFVNLTRTGYRLRDLENAIPSDVEVDYLLVCVGGNDLLSGELEVVEFERRYTSFLEHCRNRCASAKRAICNAYDPTDGTGRVASALERGKPPRPELLIHLQWLNELTARCAGADLVDVHAHFLGHAVRHRERGLPQWIFKDIEPNRDGASELRRQVWEKFR